VFVNTVNFDHCSGGALEDIPNLMADRRRGLLLCKEQSCA
jgi:hypothetical protein